MLHPPSRAGARSRPLEPHTGGDRAPAPSGRLRPPAGFPVPGKVGERVGEILAVDKWVIDHALALIGRGAQTSHYQTNVSGKSLADPGLLDFVNEAIRRHRVKPECLTFEITETALVENRNEALAFATGIRQVGCHLALDDFGTGYGALAHVKYLPVDLVKIDGMFVVNLCRSPADQAVVSKLTELCHTLGIHVAAEYVQDEATLELLRSWEVDFAQRYGTGMPAGHLPDGGRGGPATGRVGQLPNRSLTCAAGTKPSTVGESRPGAGPDRR
ncbi:EAL domain-containing protein [Micromonospora rifamycinica]|uniref:EAL domain-containing protein n=1 Tax=Micromonospora rifamycinica TaxID=291594 RepID=UPI0034068C22